MAVPVVLMVVAIDMQPVAVVVGIKSRDSPCSLLIKSKSPLLHISEHFKLLLNVAVEFHGFSMVKQKSSIKGHVALVWHYPP